MTWSVERKGKLRHIIESYIFPVILILYPLRHIHWGLDLWDTGYNYSNFQFAGLEHMDPMWFFSTYLANIVGSALTKLPFADTLLGMNFYTGLFVSILAFLGYCFCAASATYALPSTQSTRYPLHSHISAFLSPFSPNNRLLTLVERIFSARSFEISCIPIA